MGFWARFTAGKGSVNGHLPDPPPAEPPPVIPLTEPRMATDLGDALTAYWRSGEWWGGHHLVRWLINNGHMSEAAYTLREILKVPSLPKDELRGLQRQGRRLEALARETEERPALQPSDSLSVHDQAP